MNSNIFFKKIGALLSSKKKITCAPPLASPVRDWEILLLCVSIAAVALAFFAGATYISVKRGPQTIGGVGGFSSKGSVLDESALANILRLHDARKQAHEEILRRM